MNQALIIATKEVTDGLRNRWIIIITLLMAGLALILTLLGSAPTGTTKISALAVTIVSLSSLSIFFVPLIALLLSYDSVVAEDDRGTLILLLAYPVAHWHVIAGKFLGHLALLSLAIVFGYGAAAVAVIAGDAGDWADQAWGGFAGLIAILVFSALLFESFVYLISKGALDWGPLQISQRQHPMRAADRTSTSTVRRVGLEGRYEEAVSSPDPEPELVGSSQQGAA